MFRSASSRQIRRPYMLSRSISYFSLASIVKWSKNNPYQSVSHPTPANTADRFTYDHYICILLCERYGQVPPHPKHGYHSYRTNHTTWTVIGGLIDERKSGTSHKVVQILGSPITAFIALSLVLARSRASSLSLGAPSRYFLGRWDYRSQAFHLSTLASSFRTFQKLC